jgi:hypothetical protein
MASPHAVGVAALIVAQKGRRDIARGGLTLAPDQVERTLRRTATDTPCPPQEPFVYPDTPGPPTDALCEGTPEFNGFYGDGVVNALAASEARAPIAQDCGVATSPSPAEYSSRAELAGTYNCDVHHGYP